MSKCSAAKTLKSAYLLLICSTLCACNASYSVSVSAPNALENSDKLSNESIIVQSSETVESMIVQSSETVESVIDQSSETAESVTGAEALKQRLSEYNFTSVLTEDDIEYMGIPYKDLTVEQFIQLWAQCTREYNTQRLYVITYDNGRYTDKLTGETTGASELQEEQTLREYAQFVLAMQHEGRMNLGYSDVELHELEDAPDGYYDNDNGEALHYYITYTSIWYDYGNKLDDLAYTDIRWITLKKINGYWKIGVMMASSPYFFNNKYTGL